MGRGAVLLKDVGAPPGHLIHPRLDHVPQYVHVHLGSNAQAPLEEVGGMISPSFEMTPRTMTAAGNLVDMTTWLL